MRSQVRLILLAVLVVTMSTQPVFVLGAAFFQIGPELGVGPVGLGALTAAFFLTAAGTSAPLGLWVERVGWRRAFRVNLVAAAAVMLAIAATAGGVWSYATWLVLGAAVYGMSNPAANQVLARHTDPGRQATVFGLKHAGIPAATLLAGLAVPVLVVRFGWRWALVGGAALALALAAWVPRGEVATAPHRRRPRSAPGPPMTLRWLLGLALGSAFATWGAITLGTYLVSAAIHEGFTESAAGWLQFAGSGASIAGRVTAGAITDRTGASGFTGIALLTMIGAVVFALIPLAAGTWFAVLVLLAFVTGWGWPGLMTYTVVNANRASAASSSAITQTGVLVGAGVGPLALGAVIERWSFEGGWVTVAISSALAAAVVATVGRRFRTAPPPLHTGSA